MSKSGTGTFCVRKENIVFFSGSFLANLKSSNHGDVNMSALQELSPYFSTYVEKIRTARLQKGMTISDLAEKSGVPLSTVSKICSGNQSSPNLYNIIALFKTLGLSADQIFSLSNDSNSEANLVDKIQKLETVNREYEAEISQLKAEKSAEQAETLATEKIISNHERHVARLTTFFTLIISSATMAVMLLAYVFYSIKYQDVFFIIKGKHSILLSSFVWVIVVLSAAAALGSIFKIVFKWKIRMRPDEGK